MTEFQTDNLSKSGPDREIETLRQENERLSACLQAARDLVVVAPAFFGFVSPSGRLIDTNELSLRVIDAQPEDVIGQLFWECGWWKTIPASADRVRRAVEEAAHGHASQFDLEYANLFTGSDRKSWVALTFKPFFDEQRKAYRISVAGVDITDRREVQEALKQSQEQLARAVTVSKVGFYDWDMLRDQITFSEQMKKDWGLTGSDFALKDAFAQIHPEDRRKTKILIDEAVARGDHYVAEYRVVRPDGKTVWIEAQGEIIYDELKRATRFFGTSLDITERKTIEESLAAEKHKLEAIFSDAPAAVALLRGPTFIFEKVNAKYQAIFEGRDLIGKSLYEAQPELIGEPFLDWMKAVYETGKPFIGKEMQAPIREANGRLVNHYYDFTYTRVADGAGRPYGVYIHAIDVSGQVRARLEIEESERRFRHLADSMPQIVWTARPEGILDYYNLRWYELTGAKEGVGDESWAPILHPDDLAPVRETWYRSVEKQTAYQMEYRFWDQGSGAYRWYLGRAVPVRDLAGNLIKWFGTSTDIHDQKITEQALTHSNAELARFAFVASHDLKEPLRVISNYVQMLKLQYGTKLDPTADRYIGFVVNGVKRMYELINDVLSFSRIDAARPEDFKEVSMETVLKEALSNLEAAIKESGAEINVSPLPSLVVEEGQFVQLFQNLVGNAIKYRVPDRTPSISVSAEKKNTDWVISVSDNGIGIEEKYFDKIFVLFERLHGKEAYSGTGIGLAICKKIVERHGGKIWAESQLDRGSTFHFQVPERGREVVGE